MHRSCSVRLRIQSEFCKCIDIAADRFTFGGRNFVWRTICKSFRDCGGLCGFRFCCGRDMV